MTGRQASQTRAALFGATPLLAVLEASAGFGIVLICSRILFPGHVAGRLHPGIALDLLGGLWLLAWPAWRLKPVVDRSRWRMLLKGALRALIVVLVLGTVATVTVALLWAPSPGSVARGPLPPVLDNGTIVGLGFVPFRLSVLAYAYLNRSIRSRLRRQLMVSHAIAIVLSFSTMTAVGSLFAAALLATVLRPQQQVMAVWIAENAPLHGASVDGTTAQTMLNRIEQGTLEPNGEPVLGGIIPKGFAPRQVIITDLDGRILARALSLNSINDRGIVFGTPAIYPRTWQLIRNAVVRGRATTVAPPEFGRSSGDLVGAAPIRDSSGHAIAAAVVDAPNFAGSQIQLVAIGLFGASTMFLIVAAALPVLGLSFLFSYLLARNMTGGLEAVSGVATAIATGRLKERVAVTASNEIGQLAENINCMADHLEATMGELEKARTAAEDALRARQELVASISHELRTPLAVLRAHLDTLLLNGHDGYGAVSSGAENISVNASTLQALQHETERLSSLIDDLLVLSRGEAGALSVQLEPTDVAAVVDEIAALMRPLVQQDRKIALTAEASPGLPYALADGDRLRQILSNLVRNAARHTPDGGIIALSVRAQGAWVVASVADTGEGMAQEHLPYIFDRFYRVDEARARSSGAGLGLAIVRELVELMGGRVTVESSPGEGSCFQVFLPAVLDHGGAADGPPAGPRVPTKIVV